MTLTIMELLARICQAEDQQNAKDIPTPGKYMTDMAICFTNEVKGVVTNFSYFLVHPSFENSKPVYISKFGPKLIVRKCIPKYGSLFKYFMTICFTFLIAASLGYVFVNHLLTHLKPSWLKLLVAQKYLEDELAVTGAELLPDQATVLKKFVSLSSALFLSL